VGQHLDEVRRTGGQRQKDSRRQEDEEEDGNKYVGVKHLSVLCETKADVPVMELNDLREYIQDVLAHNELEKETNCVRRILVGLHRYHHFPEGEQQRRIKKFDQMFKALLTEKARQERSQKIRYHNGGCTENSSTRPADNPTRGVGIGHVLKQEVAGSGQ
jgi:hypothetical protein